jgi:hypothetical protein
MFPTPRNQYLRLLSSALLLLLILTIFDQIGGAILKRLYFSQIAGSNYRTTYSIDSTEADILVFGSSRANHHYVPEIFEDSLKMSFYNTGRDGNFLLYNYAVFKAIISRYTPKIMILDINTEDLYYRKESYDRLASLLPYYDDHPEIQSTVNLRSPYEKYKLLSAIYPYNSSLLTILIGNLEINKKRKSDRKGYIPLYNRMKDSTLVRLENSENYLDTTNIKLLNTICQICKSRNIQLFLIQSPLYAKINSVETSIMIEKIIKENNAVIMNYANDSLFIKKPEYFQDPAHLNDDGAILFSQMVQVKLKQTSLMMIH